MYKIVYVLHFYAAASLYFSINHVLTSKPEMHLLIIVATLVSAMLN